MVQTRKDEAKAKAELEKAHAEEEKKFEEAANSDAENARLILLQASIDKVKNADVKIASNTNAYQELTARAEAKKKEIDTRINQLKPGIEAKITELKERVKVARQKAFRNRTFEYLRQNPNMVTEGDAERRENIKSLILEKNKLKELEVSISELRGTSLNSGPTMNSGTRQSSLNQTPKPPSNPNRVLDEKSRANLTPYLETLHEDRVGISTNESLTKLESKQENQINEFLQPIILKLKKGRTDQLENRADVLSMIDSKHTYINGFKKIQKIHDIINEKLFNIQGEAENFSMIEKIQDIHEKSKITTFGINRANAFELGTELNEVLKTMKDKFKGKFINIAGGYKKKLRYTRRKRKYKKKTNKFFKR